jgi:type II secretory pathway pseudopilin PulG
MARNSFRRDRTGSSLVELLAVIAIIGVLLGLLLPAVQVARESGRRVGCQSNIRQVAQGVLDFENAIGRFPRNGKERISFPPGRTHNPRRLCPDRSTTKGRPEITGGCSPSCRISSNYYCSYGDVCTGQYEVSTRAPIGWMGNGVPKGAVRAGVNGCFPPAENRVGGSSRHARCILPPASPADYR